MRPPPLHLARWPWAARLTPPAGGALVVVACTDGGADAPPAEAEPLPDGAALSPDDHARLAALAAPARARFLGRRAVAARVVRDVLGPPDDAPPLVHDARGAPRLHPALALRASVSLAHAGDVLVVALAPPGRLGIDVEPLRPLRHAPLLARRALDAAGDAERRMLLAAGHAPDEAFLRAWCHLEARAKADGRGVLALLDPAVAPHVVPPAVSFALPPEWTDGRPHVAALAWAAG